MLDGGSLAVFLAAVIVIMLMPGPDMLYVLARTLREGRVAGLLAVLGIVSGIAVHTLLAAFGLSRLIAAMPWALLALKVAGAAYLVYLAVATWRAGPIVASPEDDGRPPAAPLRLWREAFLTNLLNPKALVFFLAFLPGFVGPGVPFLDLVLLGLIVAACSGLVNGALALLASAGRGLVAHRPGFAASQRVVTSGVLVAIAARMLVV